jgi:hypothetical protein
MEKEAVLPYLLAILEEEPEWEAGRDHDRVQMRDVGPSKL